MSYTIRDKNGILVGKFTGAAASNLMDCASGNGHWRSYKTEDMEHSVDAYEIDTAFIMGRENPHGEMKWYIWEGAVIICS